MVRASLVSARPHGKAMGGGVRTGELTSFLSFRLVSMTMVADFCSQTILQKSFTVSCLGPVSEGRVSVKEPSKLTP